MLKVKQLSVLLVLLVLLAACNSNNNGFEDSYEQSAFSKEESQIISYESQYKTTSDSVILSEIYDAFKSAYEIEKQFVDFLINRSIIDEGNLDIYYEEAPFVYYLLPSEHEFSTEEKLRRYFESIYFDVDAVLTELLDYPEYGPKAVSIDSGNVIISDNYRGSEKFNVDLSSLNVIDSGENSATLEFFGFDSSVGTQILLKHKDGQWVLDRSIFASLMQSREKMLVETTNWEENLSDGAMNSGTAKRLYGKSLVINIFINDYESSFDDLAVKGALSYLKQALNYIENQALKYNVIVELDYTDADSSLFFDYGNVVVDDFYSFEWTNFQREGYEDLGDYLQKNFDTSVLDEYDNYCVILHVNKPGRSYAVQCNTDFYDSDLYYTERAVMFYSTNKNYEYLICPATYAHELLHLYGAIDLYFPNDSDDTRVELAESYFWHEIMRYIPAEDINEAIISKFTAYKVGLYPFLEDQIQIFDIKLESLLDVAKEKY